MAEYIDSPEVESLARKVIVEYEVDLHDCQDGAKIKYLFKVSEKSHYAGRCNKATGKWKYLTGMDYVVEIWQPFWNLANENQRQALLYHELRHVKKVITKDGEVKWGVLKHDVELFINEIKFFGYWHQDLVGLKGL